MSAINTKLKTLSQETAISERVLRKICLAYGLEALARGELRIRTNTLNPKPFEPGATDSPE